MSKSEYQELIDLVRAQSTTMDERFSRMDERFSGMESEHRQLIDFLGVKFTKIDQQFMRIDERFTGLETRLTRVEVLHEETRHMVQNVAEGVTMTNQRIDRLEAKMDSRFDDMQATLQSSHHDLDERVTRLERNRRN